DKSEEINLMYASKYSQTANYWKNRQGMIDALTKFGTAKTKAAQEAKFNAWANKAANKSKYGNVIRDINAWYAMTNEKARHDNYLMQFLRTSSFLSGGFRALGRQLEQYAKADEAKRTQMAPAITELANELFSEVYIPAERDIMAAQLALYSSKSTGYPIAPSVERIVKDYNKDFGKYADEVIAKSILADKAKVTAFLSNPNADAIANDPL